MKQKIFSLLVLMLASVSSAWALSPTYTLKASIGTTVTSFDNISFTGQTQTLTEANIANFVIDHVIDQYASTVSECIVKTVTVQQSADGVTLNGMSISISSPFNTTATFKVEAKLKTGTSTSYNVEYMEDNALTLQLDLFHNQHSGSRILKKDAVGHWDVCSNTNGQCGKINYEEHNWSGHYCTECSLEQPHSFDLWEEDPENSGYHYAKCSIGGCGLELGDYQELTLDGMVYEAHTYSNTSGNPCVCTKCGHLNHVFQSVGEWTYNDVAHYHKCTNSGCPLNSEDLTADAVAAAGLTEQASVALAFGEHSDVDPVDGKCDVCGYEMGGSGPVTGHGHTFEDSWSYIPEGHYHKCSTSESDYQCIFNEQNGGYSVENLNKVADAGFAVHNYAPESTTPNVCTVCGYDKSGEAPVVHEHDWVGTWSWTEDTPTAIGVHYHKCQANGCPFNDDTFTSLDVQNLDANDGQQFAYSQHEYGNSQSTATGSTVSGSGYYTCEVCGYQSSVRMNQTHTCSWSGWSYNENLYPGQHFKTCTAQVGPCSTPVMTEDHSYKSWEELANETDKSPFWVCGECGFVNNQRKASAPHEHELSADWTQTDDTETQTGVHYHACINNTIGTCDLNYTELSSEQQELISYGNHEYGSAQDGDGYFTCGTCGYTSTVRQGHGHEHQWSDYVNTDPDKHWMECTATVGACYTPKKNEAPHEYGSEGAARWTCQTCGYVNEIYKTAIEAVENGMTSMAWSWDYEIPFNFEAPVLNDRRLNAGQTYTICLPYDLKSDVLTPYTIEQHSDKIVGFIELTLDKLVALTPYLVQTSKTGNPLSSELTTVHMTMEESDKPGDWNDALASQLLTNRYMVGSEESINPSWNTKLYLTGSLKYIAGATMYYIMQAGTEDSPEGIFKKMTDPNSGYDNPDNRACVLPMRAYLHQMPRGDSREFLGVRLIKADGSVTTIDRLVINAEDNTVYDLQGRRVQNPRKGSLYIIGGRKVMYK